MFLYLTNRYVTKKVASVVSKLTSINRQPMIDATADRIKVVSGFPPGLGNKLQLRQH